MFLCNVVKSNCWPNYSENRTVRSYAELLAELQPYRKSDSLILCPTVAVNDANSFPSSDAREHRYCNSGVENILEILLDDSLPSTLSACLHQI